MDRLVTRLCVSALRKCAIRCEASQWCIGVESKRIHGFTDSLPFEAAWTARSTVFKLLQVATGRRRERSAATKCSVQI